MQEITTDIKNDKVVDVEAVASDPLKSDLFCLFKQSNAQNHISKQAHLNSTEFIIIANAISF